MPKGKSNNPQNLRVPTHEEAVANGRKGGQNSGKAKRKKKMMRDTLNDWLENPVLDPKQQKQLKQMGFDDDDLTGQGLLLASVLSKAIQKGDVRALHEIREIIGEKPEEQEEKEERLFYLNTYHIADTFNSIRRDVLDGKHKEYILKGGRGGAKSSYIPQQIIEYMITHRDVNTVVLRQFSNTLRDSVYNQFIWAIDKQGLNDLFKTKTSPLEITYIPTGTKIYFRGLDDPLKLKSFIPKKGYVGCIWFEELDQFRGPEAVRSVIQSLARGTGENEDNEGRTIVFKSFNPPQTINNWANQYCLLPKDDMLVHNSTYLDVPPAWLGQTFIDNAEFLKETNPKAYEHEYLGVPNGTGGQVFENIKLEKISAEQLKTFDKIYRGVDWGYFPDIYAYVACYYDAARLTLYIFDEYTANKKSNRETADVLIKEKQVEENELITCDSAEPKSIADYKAYGLKARGAKKGPGSVDYSMKWLQSLKAIIIDPARCPTAAREFSGYEYETDKEGNVISGYPDRDNHTIDAVRYAMESVWKYRGE